LGTNKQQHVWPLWWVGTLGFVLLFLGHDVLMVGGAHAAPAVSASTDSHTYPGPLPLNDHGGEMPSAHGRVSLRHVANINGCAMTRPAVPRGDDDFGLEPTDTAGMAEDADLTHVITDRSSWAEPTASPRTRRALFQIYRI